MIRHYILDDAEKPIRCDDLHKWAVWLERFENRRVAFTVTMGVEVSTVFLGIDHNFAEMFRREDEFEDISEEFEQLNKPLPKEYRPILWETMTFGDVGLPCEMQTRYDSVENARLGHELIVAEVERQLKARYAERTAKRDGRE